MPKLQTWIFSFLILISGYFQVLSPQLFSTVNDLCQDYLSAKSLRLHQPAYQLFSHTQCHIKSKLLLSQYNAHPPTSLIFFYPLAFFSLSQATLFWDIFSVICYFLALIVLLIIARLYSFKTLAIIFAISTIWITPNLNYAVRNLSLLILLLTSLAIAGFLHKKYYSTGFLIAIATLIKLWPIIFLLPLIKYPKILLSASITLISGIFLTTVLFGFTDYFTKVVHFEKIFTNFLNNNSFTSSLTKIFYGISPNKYPKL